MGVIKMEIEIEKMEIGKVEEKEEIEIKKKIRSGDMKLSEIAEYVKKLTERISEKMERIKEIDHEIQNYREIISELEREKQRLREEIRDLNVVMSELTDGIRAVMGFMTVSKVSGKPIAMNSSNSNRGKGFKVYIKVTEAGVKAGLPQVEGEFASMAKAIYAIMPEMQGKRTDFKSKLEKLARDGLIELQFL
jgi:septal ring factor EnvC (AmiA/AmiB activator)